MNRLIQKYKMSYLRQIKSIIPQMSPIIWNLRQPLKSWAGQNRRLWTLPTGDDMPLSMMWWILLGHGWWQLTPVALEHLLIPQPPACSDLWWVCFQKCMCVPGLMGAQLHLSLAWVHPNRCCSMSVCVWGETEVFWQSGRCRCLWLHAGSGKKFL